MNVWLRKDWASGFNASFGVRYLGSQFVNDSNSVPLESYTLASGAVGYNADRWSWQLNADNLFNNERYFLPGHYNNLVFPGPPISFTPRFASSSTDSGTGPLPSWTRVDAAVYYNLTSMFRAQVNIENLFDEDYYLNAHSNTNITPGSPRAVRFALTTRF